MQSKFYKRILLFHVFLFFFAVNVFSQNLAISYQLSIKKAKSKIILDGILDEDDWKQADMAANFFQNFPYDTSFAETQTEVRMTYDDKYIYIGAVCYDPLPGDYIIRSLKRDFSYPVNDAFAVAIDPFNDQLNGFSFAVSPLGVQREGLIANGGARGVSTSWDNKWFSKVTNHSGKWIVEMAIPFRTLRYKAGIKTWRVNFARHDLKRNENSTWVPVPRSYNIASLAFTGALIWDKPPEKAGGNFSIIPYAIAGANEDFLSAEGAKTRSNTGFDAKVAVTSSLNLDITVNPDFSQVEVDKQIINLTRFSLFFPEKRQFFVENSDLFSRFGFMQIRPFFSRRIGLYAGEQIPIIAGARLSGKINRNWRIGFMSMQTEGVGALNLNSQNYTVAAFQRQVFGRSSIAGIFVNRQAFDDFDMIHNDYNRIAGLEFNLASKNNKWNGKTFYHRAFTSQNLKDQQAYASFLLYSDPKIFAMWNQEYVGKNYIADVGFVPRINNYNFETGEKIRMAYWRFEPIISYHFYPKSKLINKISPSLYSRVYLDSSFNITESSYKLSTDVKFQNSSTIGLDFFNSYTRLIFPTDITGTMDTLLPVGDYYYNNVGLSYGSDSRKKFFWKAKLNYGSFFNGNKLSYSGEINFRIQPWGIFSINARQDEVFLPAPYSNSFLTLIGPKIELTFTKSVFFTMFIQYNTQVSNININSRLQWRFKPMSDLYIVYTDNYYSDTFSIKNRALVMKFVYWFSL